VCCFGYNTSCLCKEHTMRHLSSKLLSWRQGSSSRSDQRQWRKNLCFSTKQPPIASRHQGNAVWLGHGFESMSLLAPIQHSQLTVADQRRCYGRFFPPMGQFYHRAQLRPSAAVQRSPGRTAITEADGGEAELVPANGGPWYLLLCRLHNA
jgi:hypothetical protein